MIKLLKISCFILYLRMNMPSANEGIHWINNVSSHWLRPCAAKDRNVPWSASFKGHPTTMHTVCVFCGLAQCVFCVWGVLCKKQVSRAGSSNYIPRYLWDVITCACPRYPILAQQQQVWRAGTGNYIPQYLWDVITCPCPRYLLLTQHSWYILLSSLPSQCHWNNPMDHG